MNTLPLEKRAQIIRLLVEGNSIRSCTRIADVSKNTVTKLLVDIGRACQTYHSNAVVNVRSERVQCDEIWSFVGSKEKNTSIEKKEEGCGDVWTWVGLDADSKLVVSWLVGERDADTASVFMNDLADRLTNRIQLTTDGHKAYLIAVDRAFDNDIDYAQLVKMYGGSDGTSDQERKYSPNSFNGSKKTRISGDPISKFVSTSYVERQNLTMRMHMRRFTRLTNAFSKKLENHCYAIALHFVYYNFCKIHTSLSVTPAMQAGLTKRVMTVEDIVNLVPAEAPKKRGSYKKKGEISN
ncbi:MAG: IS1 family transposase [Chitinophagaceae bacterium]|nr:IS1 family transposase [Chitinophagaceae bacterium]